MKLSGYVEFKSQQDINRSRREKTDHEYESLRRQIKKLMSENYKIVNSHEAKTN
ncbi:hypothetical protein [Bacillus sp. MMSF_3328]|uniref:hypothetical protein n=1 Tax=Bacillus sp. MMSF_3328 TaxID=3047080 RepID=UPI00273F39DB|nr:hypothetical protein [Bacillus sp. MMSF_3328]